MKARICGFLFCLCLLFSGAAAQFPVSEYPMSKTWSNGGGFVGAVTVQAYSQSGTNYGTTFKISGTLTNGYVYVYYQYGGMTGWAEAVAKGQPSSTSITGSWQANVTMPRLFKIRVTSYGSGLTQVHEVYDVDSGVGTVKKKISVNVPANSTSKPMRIEVWDSTGATVATKSFAVGEPATPWAGMIEVPSSSAGPYLVQTYIEGVAREGPSLVDYQQDPTKSVLVSSLSVPEAKVEPTAADQVKLPPPTVDLPPAPGSVASGTVWDKSTDGANATAGAVQGDLLTNKTFKQGTDIIAGKIEQLRSEEAARGEKEQEARDAEKERTDAAKAKFGGLMSEEGAAAMGRAAVATALEIATQAQQRAQSDVVDKFGGTGTGPGTAPGSSGAKMMSIQLSQNKEISFDMNPFTGSSLVAEVAAFLKRIIAWAIVGGFWLWTLGRLRQMMAAPFATAPFGDSLTANLNSIRIAGTGGGWGWAARVAILLLIGPLILAMPLGVMAALTSGLPWEDLTTIWAAGPGSLPSSGNFADVIAVVNVVLPLTLMLTAPVWYVIVEYVLFPSQFFWMVFMKVVPT